MQGAGGGEGGSDHGTSGLFTQMFAQRRALLLAFVMLLGLGAAQFTRLPAAILPEVTFPRLTVIADAGELPSEQMLRAVTRPLEASVRRVQGVHELRTTTSRGSVEMDLDFDWSADMNLALQRVQAQVDAVRASLPAGTSVDSRLMNPAVFPAIGYSLVSDTRSLAELRDIAVLRLQPELSRLPGCAEVVVQGGRRYEARVTLDPAALQARGLDAGTVADVLKKATALESVGLLEANHELYLGLADGRPTDLATLEHLAIPVADGATVPLATLGRIALAEMPEYTRYRAQDHEAVLVNLLRRPSASTVQLVDAAEQWFRAHHDLLPADVKLQVFYDQSRLVRASIDSARDSLLVGALLAILLVVMFLGSLRLGLAGAIALPGAIAATLLALSSLGQGLNMMTLGGIAAAVGLVLDDAIVVVEHLTHRHDRPRTEAMAEILPSLVGSSLCTLSIFLPFLALDGVTGAFFRVLALTMVLMLASSLVLCLTIVPLFAPRGSQKPPRALPSGRAQRVLQRFVAQPWLAAAVVLVCVLVAAVLGGALGTGFLPEMDEGALIMDYGTPPGTSLVETDRILQQVEKLISATPEVESWSRRTGDQLGFFITEPNRGDYVITLKKRRSRSADAVVDALREKIESTQPSLVIEFGQLVEDVIGDLTTNPRPIEIRIFGEDRALLQKRAREAATALGKVPGVVDLKDGIVVSGPNAVVVPDAAAARFGMAPDDVARAVQPAIAGLDAGEIVRGVRAWPVRVTLPRPEGGPNALLHLGVPVAKGRWRPLGEIAHVRVDAGETEISRDNLRTDLSVTARLSGRDLGSAMRDVQRAMKRALVLPAGMSVQYEGMWAEQQKSFAGLALVLLGAVTAVLLVLLVAFRSWLATLAVLAVTFASLAGVFVALHLGSATFNISSFVGAIMMVGIVAENAYFIVAAQHASLAKGIAPRDAAIHAAGRRARPVLMTTAAGIAALAPLALGLGAGSALLKPLALAVVGGFSLSAPLLLLVLPALLGAIPAPRE